MNSTIQAILFSVAGLAGGMLIMLFMNKPYCPACPSCDPKLQLQPFNLDAKELQKIKKSHIEIHYTPTYNGEVQVMDCDSLNI
ncbi:MAG: hypothetical protein MRZ79_04800 [Bacteroidia bacterium]|nr:hypothetical protein [Bacteroidia bacterium]